MLGLYEYFWVLVLGRADGIIVLQDDSPFPFWEVRRLARFLDGSTCADVL